MIEDNAAHNPKKTAVVAIDRTLTYARLNEESNRIAHALLQKGIGKGCFVAVLLPRNSHLIPAILGVLKTGAAFLPLDPSYPQERIDYLTSECKAAFRIDETKGLCYALGLKRAMPSEAYVQAYMSQPNRLQMSVMTGEVITAEMSAMIDELNEAANFEPPIYLREWLMEGILA